jgi:precorrin-2/cobalt-factor-2 C20-methyltransferase
VSAAAVDANAAPGCLFGVGTGPGCPELLTVKAVRVLAEAPVVAHFCKRGGSGNALRTASEHVGDGHIRLPLAYPVTTELPHDSPEYNRRIEAFFDASAAAVAEHLQAGRSVALLSEGDPFFYGSFMHVFLRLRERFPTEVIPGVPAMIAGSSQLPLPLTMRDDVLSVIPGTLPDAALNAALDAAQAAVVMKVGRNLPRIRAALRAAGMAARAWYVERASMAEQKVMPFSEAPADGAPYFSMIVVPGAGERL